MISDNIKRIKKELAESALSVGRNPEDVFLLAVTKTHPVSLIKEAYDAGLREFGENRVQELTEKVDQLPEDVKWHLIGSLQTNKVKYIIDKVSMIQSLDRFSLAKEIQKQAEKKDVDKIDVLLQVNISGEDTKSGMSPDSVGSFIKTLNDFVRLNIRGLMTIATNTDDVAVIESDFRKMYSLFCSIREEFSFSQFDILSMGMSHDFDEAVKCGSTMVRIGSSIFGERENK